MICNSKVKKILSILFLFCWILSYLYSTSELKVVTGNDTSVHSEIQKKSEGEPPIHYQLFSEVEFESEFQKFHVLATTLSTVFYQLYSFDFSAYYLSYTSLDFLFSYPLHIPVYLKNKIILI